jgi:hypothetical protein
MQPAQPATVYTDAYVWDLIGPHPAVICRLTIKHDFGRTEIFV